MHTKPAIALVTASISLILSAQIQQAQSQEIISQTKRDNATSQKFACIDGSLEQLWLQQLLGGFYDDRGSTAVVTTKIKGHTGGVCAQIGFKLLQYLPAMHPHSLFCMVSPGECRFCAVFNGVICCLDSYGGGDDDSINQCL
ncbi:hypothetical protein ARMGADRAFT_1029022 [Armillaria gallica]|uniref:Secreted protein n=1 Tax=Armillaria gallica TaxID=47427 RepID=A0A2H3E4L8_ARMGA|nr:hypothetical protein ARMGADRAFT_1029022 [Armillaria gallica]